MPETLQTGSGPSGLDSVTIEAFKGFFKEIVQDPASVNALNDDLDKTKSLSLVIDNVGSRSTVLSPQATRKLQLLLLLYDLTGANSALAIAIVRDKEVETFQDVAVRYYGHSESPVPMDASHWAAFRSQLFALQATAVLYGLITSGRLPVPDGYKADVIKVLSLALPKFDINKISILTVLKNEQIMNQIPKEKLKDVSEFLEDLQRLQALVVSPEDIPYLMKANFTSGHSIANTPVASFVETTSKLGLATDSARRIHDHAISVDMRNEQAWIALRQSRNKSKIAAIDGLASAPKTVSLAAIAPTTSKVSIKTTSATIDSADSTPAIPAATKASTSSPRETLNFDTLFGGMDETACDACSSITSPSAYLVDLLHFLQRTVLDRSSGKATLLDRLRDRRPDIENLKLSCANTLTLIPYIDLVNEVMESFVQYLATRKAQSDPIVLKASQTSVSETSDDQIAEPHNVIYDVYDIHIQGQALPMDGFYSQAVDTFRSFLAALGSSWYNFVSVFRSEHRLASRLQLKITDPGFPALLSAVSDRASAAESLNLLQTDYMAITKESFWPLELVRSLPGNATIDADGYRKLVGVLTPAQYWGFNDKDPQIADAQMLNDLSSVKKELLPRSGLVFTELIDIRNTAYIAELNVLSLKPVHAAEVSEVTPNLEDMTLRHASGTPLTSDDCDRISRFIRLWRKLGWSIAETDEALAVAAPKVNNLTQIDPDTIDRLAAIKQISEVTGLEIVKLLPLWGDIGKTLYNRIFLSRRLKEDRATFSAVGPAQSVVTPSHSTLVNEKSSGPAPVVRISNHTTTVRAALRLSTQETAAIMTRDKTPDELTLSNLSLLYRLSTFAKILDITPLPYTDLTALIGDKPLRNPRVTLAVITSWKALQNAGWTLPQLLFVVNSTGDPQSTFSTSPDTLLKTTITLVLGLELIENTIPETKPQVQQQFILDTVKVDFPDLDAGILHPLLSAVGTEKGALSGIAVFSSLGIESEILGPSFDGYFLPRSTGTYQFIVNVPSEPEFAVNGIRLVFQKQNQKCVSAEIKFENGQYYRLKFTADFSLISWRTPQLSQFRSIPLTSKMFISQDTISSSSRIGKIYERLTRATIVVNAFKLTSDEITYLQNQGLAANKIDFDGITFANLRKLQAYSSLRDSLKAATTSPLIELFKWASNPSRTGTLATQISLVTQWPEPQVNALLDACYPVLAEPDHDKPGRAALFQDEVELSKLNAVMSLASQLGISKIAMDTLYGWAEPVSFSNPSRSFTDAAALRLVLPSPAGDSWTPALTTANNLLRCNQRRALTNYLLQQQYMKDYFSPSVPDADSLFEFFLIDIQMGACLQTSRIKQAISTVQLFVQRCMLNLERDVKPETIDQGQWDWMKQETKWEAGRKVFLYPENWLDPSLRDDKTDLFTELESAMLQNDANLEILNQVVRAYIYGAHEVADLDVQAYLWETSAAPSGRFHIFGRTKTAPFHYYYRYMDLTGSGNSNPHSFWYPWTKIDIDIPSYEVDANRNSLQAPGSYLVPAVLNGRLHLFLPQITLKNAPSSKKDGSGNPIQGKKIKDMGDNNVDEVSTDKYWEIKMGWSEYRNNKWSPKQTSHTTLNIGDASIPPRSAPPDISSFRFWSRSRKISTNERGGIFAIDVEQWNDVLSSKTPNPQTLSDRHCGSFEMRGSKLVLASGDDVPPIISLPGMQTLGTKFGKLSMTRDTGGYPYVQEGLMVHGGISMMPPLLAAIPSDDKRTLTWTLSFDDSVYGRATGLITEVDSATTHGSQTFISVPPARPIVGRAPPLITTRLSHVKSSFLMEGAVTDGLDGIFNALARNVPPDDVVSEAFGRFSGPFNELSTPCAIYNWELGFHVVSLMMERLLATAQFDLAIQIARYVFDPTASGPGLQRCWLFPPFQDDSIRRSGSLDVVLKDLGPDSSNNTSLTQAVAEWRRHPFIAHSVARGRPVSYMKRIVMKYIETLIASGDDYFRRNTLETVPLAIQRYVEASHIFGPAQQQIPQLGTVAVKTYKDLAGDLDDFSNESVKMELLFPFISSPEARGSPTSVTSSSNLLGFVKTQYFCVPVNPQLSTLRKLIDDRLYKIRNCQDINGKVRRLALFDPPLDPASLMGPASDSLDPSVVLNDLDGPMPNYRFINLLQKTFELCSELKQLGSLLLATKEKRDGEALAALKARQESAIQAMTLDLKNLQKQEALRSIEALQESRRGPVSRLSYYVALTGDKSTQTPNEDEDFDEIEQVIEDPTTDDLKMTSNEALEMAKTDEGSQINQAAAVLDTTASALLALPRVAENSEPLGVGISINMDSSNIAQMMIYLASAMRLASQNAFDQASKASRKAQLIRQLQDRRLQANTAGREVKMIDKQIATEKARLASSESDIAMQQRQIKDATETENFLRSKYTNTQLYIWMDNSVRKLFYQTYTITAELARKAEKAFQFERGTTDSFIQSSGYWNSGRDGLLCAETLYLDLKRLEMAYLDSRGYDFEIVKNVSLRQTRPWALLGLRENGNADFDIPEVLYDCDFPGHYNRRIKSVSVSIPCVVGPYTSLNCTLSLFQHKYRVQATAQNVSQYVDSKDNASQFRTDNVPIKSIAVCSGTQDSGAFELNFHDERYIPFEGAGAISKWRIELPLPEFKQFDYNSISDVILHIRYTSMKGGPSFRQAATDSVRNFIKSINNLSDKEGLCAFFDLRNDYANAWYSFANAPSDPNTRIMTLTNLTDRLPFYTRGKTVTAKNISLLAVWDTTGADLTKAMLTLSTPGAVVLKQQGEPIGSFTVWAIDPPADHIVGSAWTLKISPAPAPAPAPIFDGKKLVLRRMFLVIRYVLTGS